MVFIISPSFSIRRTINNYIFFINFFWIQSKVKHYTVPRKASFSHLYNNFRFNFAIFVNEKNYR